ncbi:MAG: hypothetical protein ABL962_09795 [Fimbriimonadaceae bacterium]
MKRVWIGAGILTGLIVLGFGAWGLMGKLSGLRHVNLTKQFTFSRGLVVTRESQDNAGEDAGFMTIFRSPEPTASVLSTVRKELASTPGWRETPAQEATTFTMTTEAGAFTIRVTPRSSGGTVISVTQRVDSDRMFYLAP